MMSGENVELVRMVLEAQRRRDWQAVPAPRRRVFVSRKSIDEDGRIEDAGVRAETEGAVLTFARHLTRAGSAAPAEH
jgi:hypothetical protein